MSDNEICAKAVRRAELSGVDVVLYRNVVIFLEKEIDDYRAKIQRMEAYIDGANEKAARIAQQPTTLEAMRENTTEIIIKALSENGYNTITINAYKEC